MILKQDVEGYEIVTKIIRDFYKNYAITRLLQKLYEIFTKNMQLRDFCISCNGFYGSRSYIGLKLKMHYFYM